jgi:hypothetical protein
MVVPAVKRDMLARGTMNVPDLPETRFLLATGHPALGG